MQCDFSSREDRLECARFNYNVGSYLLNYGQTSLALQKFKYSLTTRTEILGSEDLQTLFTAGSLALALDRNGHSLEAEKKIWSVLELAEMHGEDEEFIGRCWMIAGSIAKSRGKYRDAERAFRAAVTKYHECLESRHSSYLEGLENLSVSLVDQSRYEEAEEIARRVLKDKIRVLNADDALVFVSYQNLGSIFSARCDYKSAAECFERAFSGRSRVLKSEHPHTLSSGSSLAKTYFSWIMYRSLRILITTFWRKPSEFSG